jgi:hypothetical protein
MPTITTQPYHYFASTAFGWAVAPTRAEAMASVARQAGTDIIKRNTKASGGLYCWTVRVELPQSTSYGINNYAPADVPTADVREFNLVNTKGHSLPIDRV